jgi:predicted dehydrogenase
MNNELTKSGYIPKMDNQSFGVSNGKPINLGVIGTGRFGINHLNAFNQMKRTSNIRLKAMCDIDSKICKQYSNDFHINAYHDYTKMIEEEKLSAVSIATPDHLHGDIILYALEHNLHVFVEKPLEICSEKAKKIVELAKEKNLLVQVDFHKRYDPYHMEIKQLISQGKIGKLLYGYCYMEDKIVVPKEWFPHWVNETSPAWFLGTNFVDLIYWLIRSKAITVSAKGQKGKLTSMGIDTCDSIQAMVTYDNDAVITYNFSWILPDQFPSIVNQGFRLVGTEGIIEADSQERGTISCFSSEQGMTVHNSGFIYNMKNPDGTTYYEGYGITSIQHFGHNISFLLGGGELDDIKGTYPSAEDAYEVTNIVQSIHESLETDTTVSIMENGNLIKARENTYV